MRILIVILILLSSIFSNEIKTEDDRSYSLKLSTFSWDTNWNKRVVEYDELQSGGPSRDGIPPIDKPGSLMHLTDIFKSSDANIVQIDYDRNSVKLEFGEAHVTIALETKGEEHQKLIRENLKQNGYRFKHI